MSEKHSENFLLIQHREIFKGRVISLYSDTFQKADKTITWDVVAHPGAAVIVPVAENGELLFVSQWRYPIDEQIIELPAGTLKIGEKPLECAQRELREETGYRAKQIVPLGGFYSTPGFCSEYLHLYAALDLSWDPLPRDAYEEMKVLSLSLTKAMAMIDAGEICDGKTLVGVYRYAAWCSKK